MNTTRWRVLYQLQTILAVGESFNYQNLKLTLVSAQGPRLHQIKVHRREATPNAQD